MSSAWNSEVRDGYLLGGRKLYGAFALPGEQEFDLYELSTTGTVETSMHEFTTYIEEQEFPPVGTRFYVVCEDGAGAYDILAEVELDKRRVSKNV